MCEGGSETGELLLSSVANALRQRGLELYVIITKATWLHVNKAKYKPSRRLNTFKVKLHRSAADLCNLGVGGGRPCDPWVPVRLILGMRATCSQ